MLSFESEEGEEVAYPGKVLTLYEDRDDLLVTTAHYRTVRVQALWHTIISQKGQ